MGSNASTLSMKTGYRLNPTTSQPHRYPPLPHPLLGLLHRVLTIVKYAGGQHGICAAGLDAVGQVVEVAHTTGCDHGHGHSVAECAGEFLPEKFLLGSMPFS